MAVAWACLSGLGCGSPKAVAPATPAVDPGPAPAREAAPKAGTTKPAVARTEPDPFERLMRELAEARQPGIYYTVKRLEKPELLPYLAKAQTNPRQRTQVALALQKLIERDENGNAAGVLRVWVVPEQVPFLIGFMEKRDKFNKEIIAALGEVKDPAAVEAIGRQFAKHRNEASRAFVKLGGELCPDALLPYVHYPERGVRGEARRLTGVLGTRPDAILDQTLRDLKSDVAARRWAACEYLGKFDPKSPRRAEVARALEPLLTDTEGEVNRKAWPALLRVADSESIPVLVAYVLDQKYTWYRKEAVLHLGKSKDPRAVAAVVGELKTRNWGAGRDATLQMGPAAESEVCKLIQDDDARIRGLAVTILQLIGTEKSVPDLKRALDDKHPTVRSNAKTALKRIAERAKGEKGR